MQKQQFTYDELTPLEQCIVTFMAGQEAWSERLASYQQGHTTKTAIRTPKHKQN